MRRDERNIQRDTGVSTRELDKRRADAIKRTYDCQYEDSFNKVLEVLNNERCYVYVKDFKKRMIAIYVSEQDTTPSAYILIPALTRQR